MKTDFILGISFYRFRERPNYQATIRKHNIDPANICSTHGNNKHMRLLSFGQPKEQKNSSCSDVASRDSMKLVSIITNSRLRFDCCCF